MRGTFAAELGQTAAAVTHFRQAAKLALLPIERDFIAQRIEECHGLNKSHRDGLIIAQGK
jgi:predicted RNA polymerase sigma factor